LRVKSEKGGWEDGNEVFVQKKTKPDFKRSGFCSVAANYNCK